MEQFPPVLDPGARCLNPSMSLAARMFNIIAAPGDVFDQVRNDPPSPANWLAPACLLILLSWLGTVLVFSQPTIQQQLRDITDQAIDKQVQAGKLTGQQAEQAREVAAKFGSIGSKVGGFVGPVVIGFALPFWWGLLIWLIGTKVLNSDFGYMKGVEVAGLGGVIGVLDSIVRTLLILIMGNLFASPSLALFLKQFDPQNPVHALINLVNVMTLWVLVVRSVGLARLTGASNAKAGAWVFGLWLLQTGLMMGVSFGAQRLFARGA